MKHKNIKNLTLYVVRHGKTFFNTTMQVQGCCNSFLTEIGKRQSLDTGRFLADIPFGGAYCGDLGRHLETIRIILKENKNGMPEVIEHIGLREWNFGGFEGRKDEQMWRPVFEQNGLSFDLSFHNYPQLNELLGDRGICEAIGKNDPLHLVEEYDAILDRLERVIRKILEDKENTEGENVLIVTSGNILTTFLYQYLPLAFQGENIENCSITKLLFHEGKLEVISLAEEQHLAEIERKV